MKKELTETEIALKLYEKVGVLNDLRMKSFYNSSLSLNDVLVDNTIPFESSLNLVNIQGLLITKQDAKNYSLIKKDLQNLLLMLLNTSYNQKNYELQELFRNLGLAPSDEMVLGMTYNAMYYQLFEFALMISILNGYLLKPILLLKEQAIHPNYFDKVDENFLLAQKIIDAEIDDELFKKLKILYQIDYHKLKNVFVKNFVSYALLNALYDTISNLFNGTIDVINLLSVIYIKHPNLSKIMLVEEDKNGFKINNINLAISELIKQDKLTKQEYQVLLDLYDGYLSNELYEKIQGKINGNSEDNI